VVDVPVVEIDVVLVPQVTAFTLFTFLLILLNLSLILLNIQSRGLPKCARTTPLLKA
jgi:hypothetical protein